MKRYSVTIRELDPDTEEVTGEYSVLRSASDVCFMSLISSFDFILWHSRFDHDPDSSGSPPDDPIFGGPFDD